MNNLTLGNPLDPATTLGPMANKRFADEVRAQTSEALREGRKALIDPARFPQDTGSGTYLAPQVLIGVESPDARDARGELRPGRRHHEGEGRRGSDRA